jgi:pimeloyl-ACP methyl ester carboxylesterase
VKALAVKPKYSVDVLIPKVFKALAREYRDGKRVVKDLREQDLGDLVGSFLGDAFHLNMVSYEGEPEHKYRRDGTPMVFLRHGFLEGAYSISRLGKRLPGFGINCVQYNFMGDLWDLTTNLLVEVEEEVERTGQKINAVGHSKGGLIEIIASQIRPDLFDKVVTMAVPFQGSRLGAFFVGIKPLREMWSWNPRLAEVYNRPLPESVSYLNLYSGSDLIINPPTNAVLPKQGNVINVNIPGLSHNGFLFDPRVGRVIYDFFTHEPRSPDAYRAMIERRGGSRYK